MASKFNFVKIATNFEKLKRDLPPVIGNMGQNFFRSSFEKQGFTDETFVAWKEVKRREPGTNAYKYPKKNAEDRHKRGILVGMRTKGNQHLRDSTNRSLKEATFKEIRYEVSQVYAAAHNFGLKVKNFTMPQRKFIGKSETLLKNIKDKINSYLGKLNK